MLHITERVGSADHIVYHVLKALSEYTSGYVFRHEAQHTAVTARGTLDPTLLLVAAVSKWVLLTLVVVLARLLARLICTRQSQTRRSLALPPVPPPHLDQPSRLPRHSPVIYIGCFLCYIRAVSAVEKATRSISTIRDSSKRRAKRCFWP